MGRCHVNLKGAEDVSTQREGVKSAIRLAGWVLTRSKHITEIDKGVNPTRLTGGDETVDDSGPLGTGGTATGQARRGGV